MSLMWGESDPDEVRNVWAEELCRFEAADLRGALDAIRMHNPDYPPTLFQFSGLCREAMRRRMEDTQRLPSPLVPADPVVLSKVRAIVSSEPQGDGRDWARKIIDRMAQGERMPIVAANAAREVLGL